MDIEYIRKKLQEIIALKGDDESQHSREDDLRHEVLIAIASGCPNAQDLAKEVIKSSDIEFARWCA